MNNTNMNFGRAKVYDKDYGYGDKDTIYVCMVKSKALNKNKT